MTTDEIQERQENGPWTRIRVCNCAQCGKSLVSERDWQAFLVLKPIHQARVVRDFKEDDGEVEMLVHRESGRPYCANCVRVVARVRARGLS